jgi:hypoxanthine phosphoribosyltransferase
LSLHNGKKRPEFAHPSEERIRPYPGLLWDRMGIRASNFPPGVGREQTSIQEAFAPDFYLPQQDLYVELTTLRPQLSSNKNRKIRRMKELYPDINIKLFKRRELHSMMVKYGLDVEAERIQGSQAQEKAD